MEVPAIGELEESMKCSTHHVPIPNSSATQERFESSIGVSEKVPLENASTINREQYERALQEYTRMMANQDRNCRTAPELESSQNEFLKVTASHNALQTSLMRTNNNDKAGNLPNGQSTVRQQFIMKWFQERQSSILPTGYEQLTTSASSNSGQNHDNLNPSVGSHFSKVKLFLDDVTDLQKGPQQS